MLPLSNTAHTVSPMALTLFICAALQVRALSDEVKAAMNTVTNQLVMTIQNDGSDTNIEKLARCITPIYQWLR